jgi:hypothetical protein
MTRCAWCLSAIALLVLPPASFAQTKPTYSDSRRVEGIFGSRDEGCVARCASDRLCEAKCPVHRLTAEELREILYPVKPASPDRQ